MDLCLIGCVGEVPERYDLGNCEAVLRAYGFQGFVLFKCGLTFTDILDSDEWVTKIAAGDIILAPSFGTWTPGAATTSTLTDGCGNTQTEFSETPITFTTYSTKDDYTDEDWWYAFKKNAKGYTLGYINCDGRIYLNSATIASIRAWTTGALAITNPGFNFNVVSIPQWLVGPNGVGKAGIWSVNLTIVENDVHRSAEIAGVVTALQETEQA